MTSFSYPELEPAALSDCSAITRGLQGEAGQHSSEGLGPVSTGSQGTFPLSAVPCLYHTIDCNTESAPCDFLVLTSLRRVTFKLSHLPLLVFEILSFPHSQNVIYFLTSTLYEYYLGKSDLKRNRVLFCCFFPLKYIT